MLTSEPEEISWLYFLYFLRSGGGYATHSDTLHSAQHQRLVGGTQQITLALSTKLQRYKDATAKLNSAVSRISQDEKGAQVFYYNPNVPTSEEKVTCRHVIVACSPPMAGRILYHPPMPSLRDVLTQRMQMGNQQYLL